MVMPQKSLLKAYYCLHTVLKQLRINGEERAPLHKVVDIVCDKISLDTCEGASPVNEEK